MIRGTRRTVLVCIPRRRPAGVIPSRRTRDDYCDHGDRERALYRFENLVDDIWMDAVDGGAAEDTFSGKDIWMDAVDGGAAEDTFSGKDWDRRAERAYGRDAAEAFTAMLAFVVLLADGLADELPAAAADEPPPLADQLVDVLDLAPGAPSRRGATLLAA